MSGLLATALGVLDTVPRVFLRLGGVVFYDQEVPPSLSGGGEQSMAVHKYPGGQRTVDTMGPDDHDLGWAGRFLDLAAEARCHQIDAMRRAGLVLPLTWSSFSYVVVIRAFTWHYARPWEIHYELSVTVVQDLLFAPGPTPPTVQQQVAADQASASTNAAAAGQISYGGLY